LARRRQKLRCAYHNASDYSAAAPHFARSLELHEQPLPQSRGTGRMLTELGAAQQREGNHAEALRIWSEPWRSRAGTGRGFAGGTPKPVPPGRYPTKSPVISSRPVAIRKHAAASRTQVGGNEAELAKVHHHLARWCLALGRLARAGEAAQSEILILERDRG